MFPQRCEGFRSGLLLVSKWFVGLPSGWFCFFPVVFLISLWFAIFSSCLLLSLCFLDFFVPQWIYCFQCPRFSQFSHCLHGFTVILKYRSLAVNVTTLSPALWSCNFGTALKKSVLCPIAWLLPGIYMLCAEINDPDTTISAEENWRSRSRDFPGHRHYTADGHSVRRSVCFRGETSICTACGGRKWWQIIDLKTTSKFNVTKNTTTNNNILCFFFL